MMIETFVDVPVPSNFPTATEPDVLSEIIRACKPKVELEQTKFQHVVKDIG